MGLVVFFVSVVLTGFLTSWVVILLKKIKVIEWLQVHGDEWLWRMLKRESPSVDDTKHRWLVNELASCDFCLNWWIAWAVVLIALIVTGWWWLLSVPFFSTPVGRFLC